MDGEGLAVAEDVICDHNNRRARIRHSSIVLIKEGLTKENWGVINYYDLDKQGWRSFKITHLCKATPITVVTSYMIDHVGEAIYSA